MAMVSGICKFGPHCVSPRGSLTPPYLAVTLNFPHLLHQTEAVVYPGLAVPLAQAHAVGGREAGVGGGRCSEWVCGTSGWKLFFLVWNAGLLQGLLRSSRTPHTACMRAKGAGSRFTAGGGSGALGRMFRFCFFP